MVLAQTIYVESCVAGLINFKGEDMSVNLISCDDLPKALVNAIENLSEEDKATLCEALNCGSDLNEIVSTIKPNMITVGEDGKLIVKPSDMVSTDANNIIVIGSDGKLYVDKTAASVISKNLISGDVGNIIVEGSDKKLYARTEPVNPGNIISGNANNSLTLGTDGNLYVETVVPQELISHDAGNIIKEGSDKLLFASVDTSSLVSGASGNSLTVRDGKLYVETEEVVAGDLISKDANNDLKLGSDKKLWYNRGITWTTTDPGAGSPLEEGHIVLVYEEVTVP